MATLLQLVDPPNHKIYLDKSSFNTVADQRAAVVKSSTLYVGNLSFYTTEEQLHELFTDVGLVKTIVMGLHRVDRTPCGFCFVEFRQVASAVAAEKYLNGATLDGRVLKIERDPGFKEGRQYGRARSGGQVRDEIRTTFDAARGGFGALVAADVAANDAATPSGFQPPPQMRMPNPMGGPGPRGRPRFGQSNMMMPIPMGGPSGGMPMGGPSGGMPMGGPSGGMPMGGPSGGMRGRPRPGTTFLARGPMPQMLGPRGEPVMHPMMQVHNGGGGHHGRSDQQHRGGGGDVRFRGAERDRHGGGRGDQRGGGGGDRFGRDRQRPRDDDRDRDRDRDSRSDVDEFGRDQTRRRRNPRFRDRSDDEEED